MLSCRRWAIEETVSHEQLTDLLDAIHNLPKAVRDWARQDPEYLRGKIQDYDDRWSVARLGNRNCIAALPLNFPPVQVWAFSTASKVMHPL